MTKTLKQILLDEKAEQEVNRNKEETNYRRKRQNAAIARKSLLSHLRPATVEEYVKWLKKRIEVHGAINLNFFRDSSRFYIATEYFTTVPLYGADAIHILIPNSLGIRPGDLGHNILYLENGEIVPHDEPVSVSDEDMRLIED